MTSDEFREAERVLQKYPCTSPEAEAAMKALLKHWREEVEW